MLWPGLNARVIQGNELLTYKQLSPDPDYEQKIMRIRDQASKIRYTSLPPLLRGWSGPRFPGQSVGAPDPVGDCTYGIKTGLLLSPKLNQLSAVRNTNASILLL